MYRPRREVEGSDRETPPPNFGRLIRDETTDAVGLPCVRASLPLAGSACAHTG
jgi:hypothetical protein